MNRGLVVLGRLGTVLVAAGLALGLVSLLPTLSFNLGSGMGILSPDTYTIPYSNVYSARLESSMNMETNSTLELFMVSTDPATIYDWINVTMTTTIPQLPTMIYSGMANVTSFLAYLDQHQSQLVWQGEATADSPFERQFTPTEVGNYTLVVANSGPSAATYRLIVSQVSSVAPRRTTTTLTIITLPLGLILSAPWVADGVKKKRSTKHI